MTSKPQTHKNPTKRLSATWLAQNAFPNSLAAASGRSGCQCWDVSFQDQFIHLSVEAYDTLSGSESQLAQWSKGGSSVLWAGGDANITPGSSNQITLEMDDCWTDFSQFTSWRSGSTGRRLQMSGFAEAKVYVTPNKCAITRRPKAYGEAVYSFPPISVTGASYYNGLSDGKLFFLPAFTGSGSTSYNKINPFPTYSSGLYNYPFSALLAGADILPGTHIANVRVGVNWNQTAGGRMDSSVSGNYEIDICNS